MKDWLIFLVSLRCLFAQEYIIERQVALIKASWIDQPDNVLLPRSMCTGDVTAKCKSMGGTRMKTTCGCECTDGNESTLEFYKSTFGFYENQWKCFENKKVRSQAGCKTIMNERQDTIHLMTFPMAKPLIGHKIPGLSNTRNCAITGGKYLKCNGNWKQLNSKLVKSRFYLEENEYLYYSTSQPSTPTINGRVVRLEIKCTQPTTSQCVLFKVKGQMKCPLTTPTSALPSPRTNNITFTTLTRVTTTPLVLTDQFNKTGQRASSKHVNSGLIAGALAGAIGLSIVIVIIVVLRRRKKRYAVPKTNDRVVENEIYGLGLDTTLKFVVPGQRSQDEDEYSYATNIKTEVHQCRSSMHVQSEAHSHSHSEEPEYTIPYKGGSTPQPCLDAPIYDTPVASEEGRIRNNNQSDQIGHHVYNVLEGPAEVKSHEIEEPSCYQNREGTFPEGAIVNGSSEGPVSSRSSFKGPGPHSNLDISKTAGKEDGSHDDVIYDYNHVGEVLID